MKSAAIGVADHNGWANLVTVAIEAGRPAILDRRRVELVEPHLPREPYHRETLRLPAADGDTVVTLVRASAAGAAIEALAQVAADLEHECLLQAIAIRTPPIDTLPGSVAEVHASRRVMIAADGMIYHEALCTAARARGLGVVLIARRTEFERAAQVLGIGVAEAETLIEEAGAELGPPWHKEHKFAVAAATAALASARPRR